MANTDWLTTLLSGVSGAFTGYGQANERRASAAELARQIARQTELDSRQQQQDAARQFSQGLQDEAALTNLGYVRGDVPKQFSGAMMPLPMGGAFDAGSAVDAMRVGPSRTTPGGERFTLDRAQTPQARTMRAAEMERESARAEIQRRAQERADLFRQQKELKQMEIGAADARAARSVGPTVPTGDGRDTLTPAQRSTLTEKERNLMAMKEAINQYRTLLSDVGVSVMPTERQARLVAAYTNLQMKAKNAAELGALSGPDMGILENWITPPNSPRALAREALSGGRGAQQLLAQLDEYEKSIDSDTNTMYRTYGVQAREADRPVSGADLVRSARRAGGRP